MTMTLDSEKASQSGVVPDDPNSLSRGMCGEEEFIPVVELEREIPFPTGKAMITLVIFANGEILARLKGTDVTAEGASVEETIAFLKLEIEEEYYFLKEINGSMANHMKKQFDIIKRFFEKI